MRSNIPSFRLPQSVLDEEIGMILDMGVELAVTTPVSSLRALLQEGGYDAVFIGSGAPKGKELELPGRHDTDRIHIASPGWSRWRSATSARSASAYSSSASATPRWTAAAPRCAWAPRASRSWHASPGILQASDWELEDAEEENVEIIVNHAPKNFVIEGGKLSGMRFEQMEYQLVDGVIKSERVTGEVTIPCDDVISRSARRTPSPGSSAIWG